MLYDLSKSFTKYFKSFRRVKEGCMPEINEIQQNLDQWDRKDKMTKLSGELAAN